MLLWLLIRQNIFDCLLAYFYRLVGFKVFEDFLLLMNQITKQRSMLRKKLILFFIFALSFCLLFCLLFYPIYIFICLCGVIILLFRLFFFLIIS